MRRRLVSMILALFLVGCGESKTAFDTDTSLGKLLEVEKRTKSVSTDIDPARISPGESEVLFLLTFSGQGEITYTSGRDYPLISSSGSQFYPTFAGNPTGDDTLSGGKWLMTGVMGGQDGTFVMQGAVTYTLPKSQTPRRTVFVYVVPKDAGALTLKDGDHTFPIGNTK